MPSTTAAKAPTPAATRPVRRVLKPALAIAFWLVVWQVVSMAVGRDFLLASPVAVIARLGDLVVTADFWATIGTSLADIATGFGLAAIVGCLGAAAAARFDIVDALLAPLVAAVRAAPVVSFIVIVLLWADSGQLAAVTSFLMVVPVVHTNVLEGLRQRDVQMQEMATVFRLSPVRRVLAIDLPAVLPYFAAACRTGVGLAWKSGVAAEVIGVVNGSIGERLYEAKLFLDSAGVFAWTVVIVAVSVACEALVVRALKRLEARLAARIP